MRTIRKRAASIRGFCKMGGALLPLIWAQASFAQAQRAEATDTAANQGVAEIVVTAQKREESASKVPMSITALSSEQLANRQITSPQDLVKVVPGFQFAPSLSGTPVYTIRGIGFNDTSTAARPTVSVYVDQAPIPFSIETIGATLDLERVEVLKGPQGTLFGQNSTGGAINYIAAKPTDTFKAGGSFTYGSYNEADIEGFVSGPLSDTLSVRIAAKHEGRDAWQISQTRNDTLGKKDVNVGRILLTWKPTSALTFNLNVNGFTDHSDQQAAQFYLFHATTPSQIAKIPTQFVNMAAAPHNDRIADWTPGVDYAHHDKYGQVTLRSDLDLSRALQLTSLTTYSSYNGYYNQDPDGSSYLFFQLGLTSHFKTFSEELRASINTGNLKLIAGGNYEHTTVHQIFDERLNATPSFSLSALPGGPAQFTHVAPRFDYTTDVYALFANADYDLSSQFAVHGGIRYTRDKTNFAGCNYDGGDGAAAQGFNIIQHGIEAKAGVPLTTIAPGGCITFSTVDLRPEVVKSVLDENSVSWRAGIDFKPSSRTLIYANVSKGYKLGSYPELGASFSPQYKPAVQESVLAGEVGIKATTRDHRLRFDSAFFYYDYTNKQVFGSFPDPQFGALKAEVNVPKSRLYGAEASLTLAPTNYFTLSASTTYLNSDITKDFSVLSIYNQNLDVKGEQFPFTPKWSGLIDAEVHVPATESTKVFFGASMRAQTGSNAELGNYPDFRIDGYTLVDLRAGIRSNDGVWRASAFMNNAANKYYWNNASTYEDTVARFTGMPRTIGISVSFRTK